MHLANCFTKHLYTYNLYMSWCNSAPSVLTEKDKYNYGEAYNEKGRARVKVMYMYEHVDSIL